MAAAMGSGWKLQFRLCFVRSVRVDVRNFNAIDGDYVYGEIQRSMDLAGVLCYEVRLRGTDTYIVVKADKVQEVGKHDKHYLESVVEPIKVMEKLFTKEELKGFIKGNILKYRLRMGHKESFTIFLFILFQRTIILSLHLYWL